MDADSKAAPEAKPGVNCPRCRRLFGIPMDATDGDTLRCPFCSAPMVLRWRTLLVAEPTEPA